MQSRTVTFSYNASGFIPPTDSSHAQLLVDTLSQYPGLSPEAETQWSQSSRELVEILKDWRKLYKALDSKKRELKRKQMGKKQGQEEEEEEEESTEGSGKTDESNEESDRPAKKARML